MKADPREGSQIRAGKGREAAARAPDTAKNLVAAAAALMQAVAGGEVTPGEAADLSRLVANTAQAERRARRRPLWRDP